MATKELRREAGGDGTVEIAGLRLLPEQVVAVMMAGYVERVKLAAAAGEPPPEFPLPVQPVFGGEDGKNFLLSLGEDGPFAIPYDPPPSGGRGGGRGGGGMDQSFVSGAMLSQLQASTGEAAADGEGGPRAPSGGGSKVDDYAESFVRNKLQGFASQAAGSVLAALGSEASMVGDAQQGIFSSCFGGGADGFSLSNAGIDVASMGMDQLFSFATSAWQLSPDASAGEAAVHSLVTSQVFPQIQAFIKQQAMQMLGLAGQAPSLSDSLSSLETFFGGDSTGAGQPAVRCGVDVSTHGGVVTPAALTVLVNGAPPARLMDVHTCPVPVPPHNPNFVVGFNPTIVVQGSFASAVTSPTSCTAMLNVGSANVYLGPPVMVASVAAPPAPPEGEESADAPEGDGKGDKSKQERKKQEEKPKQHQEREKEEKKTEDEGGMCKPGEEDPRKKWADAANWEADGVDVVVGAGARSETATLRGQNELLESAESLKASQQQRLADVGGKLDAATAQKLALAEQKQIEIGRALNQGDFDGARALGLEFDAKIGELDKSISGLRGEFRNAEAAYDVALSDLARQQKIVTQTSKSADLLKLAGTAMDMLGFATAGIGGYFDEKYASGSTEDKLYSAGRGLLAEGAFLAYGGAPIDFATGGSASEWVKYMFDSMAAGTARDDFWRGVDNIRNRPISESFDRLFENSMWKKVF